MMSDITLQIGCGSSAKLSFSEATDEWVWMRIYELRDHGLSSQLTFAFVFDGHSYVFATPRLGEIESPELPEAHHPTVMQVRNLWMKMSLDTPDYTAGAAVLFVRRFRKLFPEISESQASLATA